MRWDSLRLDSSDARDPAGGTTLPLIERNAVARTFDTPEFRGMTFYEIHAKSIVSEVPKSSRMMFRYTINPYRGCQHSCRYCFARQSHTYLDMDAGRDFDTRVVVKVNAPELLRAKLASPSWGGEHIAMGTNVDPYQRAEGRYKLTRGIIEALRDAANPFSILTKGTLITRDLDLLLSAAEVTDVGLNVSAAFVDKSLWRAIEPGTPAPERRIEACAALNDVPRPARGDRQAGRGGGRGARHADRPAPAARCPRMVPRLARRGAPGTCAQVRGALRTGRVRAQGLPGEDRRPGSRPGGALRRRARRRPPRRRNAARTGHRGGPAAAARSAARTALPAVAGPSVTAPAGHRNSIDQHRSELNKPALLTGSRLAGNREHSGFRCRGGRAFTDSVRQRRPAIAVSRVGKRPQNGFRDGANGTECPQGG
jgi:hypothetical protein